MLEETEKSAIQKNITLENNIFSKNRNDRKVSMSVKEDRNLMNRKFKDNYIQNSERGEEDIGF